MVGVETFKDDSRDKNNSNEVGLRNKREKQM